jgi:hypothetical protein
MPQTIDKQGQLQSGEILTKSTESTANEPLAGSSHFSSTEFSTGSVDNRSLRGIAAFC